MKLEEVKDKIKSLSKTARFNYDYEEKPYAYHIRVFKGKDFEFIKEYYKFTEDDFFVVDIEENCYKTFREYKSYIKYYPIYHNVNLRHVAQFQTKRGATMHYVFNKQLIKGYVEMYKKWYYENGYDDETYYMNLYLNARANYVVNFIGLYWMMEDETYDIELEYTPSTYNPKKLFYTMIWKMLIINTFYKAKNFNFNLFYKRRGVPEHIVRRWIDKSRKSLVNRIKERNKLSTAHAYCLRALVELGYGKYAELANTTPRTFTHERTCQLFPIKTNLQKEKELNKKLFDKNKIELDELYEDDFMESIWDNFNENER